LFEREASPTMPPPVPDAIDALTSLPLLAAAPAATSDAFGFGVLTNYLLVGAVLMALGMLGFLARRNLIIMFLSAELMLQGTALTLVGFGRYHGNWTGIVFTIFILTIAACEAALALALILVLFKRRSTLDVTLWQEIREEGLPPTREFEDEAAPAEPVAGPETYPHLTPAGVEPPHPRQPWERRRD
jgi:NADH-quinone oxidoreductase subunit K